MLAPYRLLGGLATDGTYIDATSRNWYRVDDVDMSVSDLNQQGPVFFQMLNKFRRGPNTTQPKYSFWLDDVAPVMTYINAGAGYAAGITAFTVDDATIFTENTLVLNQRTNELMLVASVDTTTTITVVRAQLGTVATALLDNDELMSLGAGLAEKGVANLAGHQLPVSNWNYVSFFSIKKQITELQSMTEMNFSINMPTEMQRGWFELQRALNQHILWSRKGTVDDATVGRYYYTDGYVTQIKTNRLDLSGVDGILTWPMFNDYMRNIGKNTASSPAKALICGVNLFAALNQISYNQATPVQYSETLGTSVKRIITDEGMSLDIALDRHSFPGRHSGHGLIVDMNHVQLRTMRGYEFKVRENIQSNDSHVREDEIYGSVSVQVDHEEVHGLITGCVGPY